MKKIKTTLTILIAIFFPIIGIVFSPMSDPVRRTLFPLVAFLSVILSCLGIYLLVLTKKVKLTKKLKKSLVLTGIFASGLFFGTILHNFFYALAIVSEKIIILSKIMQFIHATMFIFATLICPIGFIISTIVSVNLLKKKGSK